MTEMIDIAAGIIKLDELIPKVTLAISGKYKGQFAIGLFYKRNNLMYCKGNT